MSAATPQVAAPKVLTHTEWLAEAERRFGADPMGWRFVCPCCKHVASVADWKAAGATEGEVAVSCVGRHLPKPREAFTKGGKGPCNYAGYGLFRLNPTLVDMGNGKEPTQVFAFADEEATQ